MADICKVLQQSLKCGHHTLVAKICNVAVYCLKCFVLNDISELKQCTLCIYSLKPKPFLIGQATDLSIWLFCPPL